MTQLSLAIGICQAFGVALIAISTRPKSGLSIGKRPEAIGFVAHGNSSIIGLGTIDETNEIIKKNFPQHIRSRAA